MRRRLTMSFAQRKVPRLPFYENITNRERDICMGDEHSLLLGGQGVCLLVREHGLICFCLPSDRPGTRGWKWCLSFAQRNVPKLPFYDNFTNRERDICMGDEHSLFWGGQGGCLLVRQHGFICFCFSFDRPATRGWKWCLNALCRSVLGHTPVPNASRGP